MWPLKARAPSYQASLWLTIAHATLLWHIPQASSHAPDSSDTLLYLTAISGSVLVSLSAQPLNQPFAPLCAYKLRLRPRFVLGRLLALWLLQAHWSTYRPYFHFIWQSVLSHFPAPRFFSPYPQFPCHDQSNTLQSLASFISDFFLVHRRFATLGFLRYLPYPAVSCGKSRFLGSVFGMFGLTYCCVLWVGGFLLLWQSFASINCWFYGSSLGRHPLDSHWTSSCSTAARGFCAPPHPQAHLLPSFCCYFQCQNCFQQNCWSLEHHPGPDSRLNCGPSHPHRSTQDIARQ